MILFHLSKLLERLFDVFEVRGELRKETRRRKATLRRRGQRA